MDYQMITNSGRLRLNVALRAGTTFITDLVGVREQLATCRTRAATASSTRVAVLHPTKSPAAAFIAFLVVIVEALYAIN